jgi:hypothetical protein
VRDFEGPVFDLYAGASQEISVLPPLLAGQACTLHAQVQDGDGTVLATQDLQVPATAVSDRQMVQALQTSGGGQRPEVYLLLVTIGALIGLMATVLLRRETA